MKIKKFTKEEKRDGLLDSGATNNVREVKDSENFKGIIPIAAEVAFESEVTAELFINPEGAVIGPKGTETIVSTHKLVKVGYQVSWKKSQLFTKKGEAVLQVEIKSGPVSPNEICLNLIDEIEESKRARVRSAKTVSTEDELQLKNIWPQLKKVLKWLLKNNFERALELLGIVAPQRQKLKTRKVKLKNKRT